MSDESAPLRPMRRSRPSAFRASVEVEVPFHDVDVLGVVWHGHYYKYLEIARTALLRELGLDGRTTRLPYTWVVIESQCRHSAPLRFGDRFVVECWLEDIDHRVNIAYEIRIAATGMRCARAQTVLATLDESGELLLNTPEGLLRFLRAPGDSVPGDG